MAKANFISGFSTVKNGIKLGYPLAESIKSVLPVVDEFVITVGKSEDKTLDLIKKIGDPKIKIIETVWDPRFTVKGRIIAQETGHSIYRQMKSFTMKIKTGLSVFVNSIETMKKSRDFFLIIVIFLEIITGTEIPITGTEKKYA